jgi:hypothetical protein
LDFFFFQLAIIFLPGLIWERVVTKYALSRAPTPFEIGLRTFTFGLTAYVITYAILTVAGIQVVIPEFKKDASFIIDKRFLTEFATAVIVAVCGSVFWLYALNYRWSSRILRCIGATKKYGGEDVWDFTFNSSDPWSEYVHVRDYANNKIYSGWVKAFSESEKTRELLLREVEVFDLEGTRLYSMPLIYLGCAPDSVYIEFPVPPGGSSDVNATE